MWIRHSTYLFILFCSQISNTNCLVELSIHVDTILYLSLYYLVSDLIHLPNPTINTRSNEETPYHTQRKIWEAIGRQP